MYRFAIGLTIASLLGLAACGDDTSDTEDTDVVCGNSVKATFPADGASGVYYRTTIEAELDDAEDDANLTVTGPDGDVAGSMSWNGDTMVFSPSVPLAPNAAYTVDIDFSCGNPSVTFNTGEVGGDVDEASLIGSTYELDLTSGRFIQPEGVGSILQQYIGDTVIFLGVTAADTSEIQMLGAIGVPGTTEQDLCSPTIPFPTADFTATPFFEVGPDATTIAVEGYEITIDDLYISGAFAPDGSYISGARLAGSIDTRPLVPLVDPEGEDGAICDLAGSLGITCEACGDGEPYCLSLEVDSIAAAEVAGLTLVERTEADVAGDDTCTGPE